VCICRGSHLHAGASTKRPALACSGAFRFAGYKELVENRGGAFRNIGFAAIGNCRITFNRAISNPNVKCGIGLVVKALDSNVCVALVSADVLILIALFAVVTNFVLIEDTADSVLLVRPSVVEADCYLVAILIQDTDGSCNRNFGVANDFQKAQIFGTGRLRNCGQGSIIRATHTGRRSGRQSGRVSYIGKWTMRYRRSQTRRG